MTSDYLIVGAGFTGASMARLLADAGKRVLVIDKRDHIGGNAYDYVNEHGVRIHKYGPHIFHTNSDKVFAFLSQFTNWRPYEHRVLASVEGKLVPFPINRTTLEMLGLTREDCAPDESIARPQNAEEQCLQRVGRKLYELFFEGYTTKMWGRHPRELDASVTARIPVRWDSRDDRYFTDKHQAMPKDGYAALFERMLDHSNIEVRMQTKPRSVQRAWKGAWPKVVFTGAIDAFFRFKLGRLPYRSIRFAHEGRIPSPTQRQVATTNFPSSEGPTRETEWAVIQSIEPHPFSWFTKEYPTDHGEPYYPVPSPAARDLYRRYEALAVGHANVTFLGRLGRYQYINMDQAVGQALVTAERMLASNPSRS